MASFTVVDNEEENARPFEHRYLLLEHPVLFAGAHPGLAQKVVSTCARRGEVLHLSPSTISNEAILCMITESSETYGVWPTLVMNAFHG